MTNREKYADPTLDWSFKRIFLTPGHENILKTFLNDVLEGELVVDQVTSVKGIEQAETKGKRIIYDIHCKTSKDEHFIVEIQRQKEQFFFKRMDYYRSRSVSGQIKTAGLYPQLMPVIVVAVCDFNVIDSLFPGTKGVYFEKLYYTGKRTQRRIEGPPNYIFLDLPQYRKMKFPKNSLLEEWFQIFTCQDIPDDIVLSREETKMALDDLDIDALNLEEKSAMEIEALEQEKARQALITAKQDGVDEGKAERDREIARSMKAEGLPDSTIAKITGLSLDEIKKI